MGDRMLSTKTASKAVQLPKSIKELRKLHFAAHSIPNILKITSAKPQSNPNDSSNKTLTLSQRTVLKYSATALQAGRPMGSVIIFMAGASGSGKSSTINALFEDDKLCPVSSSSSETKLPTLVKKNLCVTAESPPVEGYLGFVDIPGTFDTDMKKEAVNMASIRKFKQSSLALKNRGGLVTKIPQVAQYLRPSVFPNVVLFIIKATDDRMDGESSFLVKTLKAFQKTAEFIDTKHVNVIAVLTNVMALGINKKKFEAKLDEKVGIVQKQFRLILGIPDVDVIPIENEPDDYDLEKFGDFYKLPNGQLSHLNLYNAMQRCFERNNDNLGRLFTSWYFGSDCIEKTQKAETIQSVKQLHISEIEMAEEDLKELQIFTKDHPDQVPVPIYNFQSLGHGYCPVTEEIKPVTPLHFHGKLNPIPFENSQFLVPDDVQVTAQNTTQFRRLSFLEKDEYQQHMQHKYGLEVGFNLKVATSSDGRWLNNDSGKSGSELLSLIQEIQIAKFSLNNPKEKELSSAFQEELESLPDKYNDGTVGQFQAFFSRWGSHLIIEEAIGGAIQLNCTAQGANLTSDKLNNVEAKVSGIFSAMLGAKANYDHSKEVAGLREAGVSNEHLRIDGGIPPLLVTLETINAEQMQSWSKTVPENPAVLRSSIKLYPYYNFLDFGSQYSSLVEATKDYLSNNLCSKLEERIEPIRNQIAQAGVALAIEGAVGAENDKKGNNCFPAGSLVTMGDGTQLEVEKLGGVNDDLLTLKLKGNKLVTAQPTQTSFCTYLDAKEFQLTEYLILEFSNGKSIKVSPGHMIFEAPQKHRVIAKQAKDFEIGESAMYVNGKNGSFVVAITKLEKIVKTKLYGAYAPLTLTGTLIVDGFFVSSYAKTNSFLLAEMALLPLKMWTKYTKNRKSKMFSGFKQPNGTGTEIGIHPYAEFLLALRNSRKLMKINP